MSYGQTPSGLPAPALTTTGNPSALQWAVFYNGVLLQGYTNAQLLAAISSAAGTGPALLAQATNGATVTSNTAAWSAFNEFSARSFS